MDILNFLSQIGKNVEGGAQRFGQELANGAHQAANGAGAVVGSLHNATSQDLNSLLGFAPNPAHSIPGAGVAPRVIGDALGPQFLQKLPYMPYAQKLPQVHPNQPMPYLPVGQVNNGGYGAYGGIQPSTGLDGTLQGNPDINLQGGSVNPGYIPYQNSGFGGPGYVANLQPANPNIQGSMPRY